MTRALEFIVFVNMIGVLACIVGAMILLYLLIQDKRHGRK